MNDLFVITGTELAAWSVLVAVMAATLTIVGWLALRLRDSACRRCTAARNVDIEDMPGHPERINVLPDPVEERTFGVIGDRLLRDAGIAQALDELGWHE
ncbi:hypothetical protein ABT299_11725 [Spirillospora sp. NPDC000708]